MFWTVLTFEVKYHIKRPVTYLYFAVLFLMGFFLISSDVVQIVGGVALVKRNGPYALAQAVLVLTMLGVLFSVAIVGTSLLRDFRFRVHELLFTTHMSRLDYLGGRFVGSYLVMLLVFLAIPIGTLLGAMAPWIDPEFVLPPNPWWHLQPFLLFTVPTLLAVGAIFFALGALTRSLVVVYTSGFALIVAWNVAGVWTEGLENDVLSNVVDLFGMATLELTTRYWTIAERNSLTLPLDGWFLANRAVWLGIGLALLGITFAFFRFKAGDDQKQKKAVKDAPPPMAAPEAVVPSFGSGTAWRQLLDTTTVSFRHMVKDKMFIALVTMLGLFGKRPLRLHLRLELAAIEEWLKDSGEDVPLAGIRRVEIR